jgi:tetratricopeptide (TPR) repeat protein
MDHHKKKLAWELYERAHALQMKGQWDEAVRLYLESIDVFPTAEAHTFLGWTYRFQGNLQAAIDECMKAIRVDPTLGNPYNDIGAYLIEMERYDEAIPWLEKATAADRYQAYHYAWYNLGRAWAAKEAFTRARECFQKAVALAPEYSPAKDALEKVRRVVQ